MPELAAHLERVARELAEQLVRQIWPLINENDSITERDAIQPLLAAALAACAREAKLEEHKLDCPRCIPMLRCIGYPDCDGDLPGEEHSEKCLAIGPITWPCERLAALERAVGEKGQVKEFGG